MLIGLASMAMMVAACGGGSIGEPEGASNVSGTDTVAGLLLDENSDTVTRGRFITSDGQISFSATSDATSVSVRIQLNGKTFDVTINGSVIMDGHDAVLTSAEKALLLNFSETMTARFQMQKKGADRFETLAVNSRYFSQAPEGHVHVRLVDGIELPEGTAAATTVPAVRCVVKSTTVPVTATYTTSTGAVFTKSVLVGSDWGTSVCGAGDYRCMGLCGGGCTPAGSYANWTQDCLDHDTCSHEKCSTLGPFDSNCKDEFNRASDDANAYVTLSNGTKVAKCPGTAVADAGG
jgi:hypothetical protein